MRVQGLRLWALLDQNSLLDTLAQEVLDSVDRVVFDKETTAECRSLALVFMMGHTEGFELLDEEEAAMSSGADAAGGVGSKRSKSKVKNKLTTATAQAGDVKRRQRCAVQLETLCELINLHQENNSSLMTSAAAAAAASSSSSSIYANLSSSNSTTSAFRSNIRYMVEAFNGLEDPRRNIVRDWSTMTSLLLKESDGLISAPLRPELVSILLSMFVDSVLTLQAEFTGRSRSRSKDTLKIQVYFSILVYCWHLISCGVVHLTALMFFYHTL